MRSPACPAKAPTPLCRKARHLRLTPSLSTRTAKAPEPRTAQWLVFSRGH